MEEQNENCKIVSRARININKSMLADDQWYRYTLHTMPFATEDFNVRRTCM